MKKIIFNFGVILFLLSFGNVCIELSEASSQKPEASASLKEPGPELVKLAEKYRDMALAFEKSDQLQKALYFWKIAVSLNPGDKEIDKRIAELKINIENKAEKHFNQGVSDYKRNSMKKAKKEFLTTLRYNPRHIAAMDYLKNRFGKDDHTIYIVKKGDTLKAIAKETYHDQKKDILIAFYNDLDVSSKLKPNAQLKIPVLEEKLTKKMFDIENRLNKARAFLKTEQFEKTISVANKILDYDYQNKETRDLINVTYYQWGRKLYSEKKYEEAIDQLNKADPGYPGVAMAIADVEKAMQDDIHKGLQRAQDSLKAGQFEKALAIAGEVRESDFFEREAADLINSTHFQWGRKLYNSKQYEEAINEFKKADPGYPGVALAISDVEKAMQDDVHKELQRAQDSLKTGQFEKALAIAGEVRGNDFFEKEAADLINATYFQWGHKLSSEKKYVEAIKRFSKAGVDYPGASDAIADVKKMMLKQAQAHYITGIKYYTDDQLELAILEWEKTLSLDPNHEKAKKSIADAQKLLNMLKKK